MQTPQRNFRRGRYGPWWPASRNRSSRWTSPTYCRGGAQAGTRIGPAFPVARESPAHVAVGVQRRWRRRHNRVACPRLAARKRARVPSPAESGPGGRLPHGAYEPRLSLQADWIGGGPLSQWLFSALAEAGLPVICVETRHMRAVQPVWNEEDCGEGNGPLSSRPRARVNECPNWTPWEERR
jgi:hypothetical protein